jgi:hypothetical protein
MLNNITDINKANIHLSPQTIECKKTTTYGVGNPGHSYKTDAGLNRLMGSFMVPMW